MKKYKEKKQTVVTKTLDEIQCDVCKRLIKADDYAAQEVLHIRHEYGYGSTKFGDMSEIEVDICEECVFEMLGPFCRVLDGSIIIE